MEGKSGIRAKRASKAPPLDCFSQGTGPDDAS